MKHSYRRQDCRYGIGIGIGIGGHWQRDLSFVTLTGNSYFNIQFLPPITDMYSSFIDSLLNQPNSKQHITDHSRHLSTSIRSNLIKTIPKQRGLKPRIVEQWTPKSAVSTSHPPPTLTHPNRSNNRPSIMS